MWRSIPTALAIGLAFVQPVTAQDRAEVRPGTEIRLTSTVFTGTAIAIGLDAEELAIVIPGMQSTVGVPTSTIERIEVRVPRTASEGGRRGAVRGVLIGGLAWLMADVPEDPDGFWDTRAGALVSISIMGAGVGTLVGRAYPGHRWLEAEVPPSR